MDRITLKLYRFIEDAWDDGLQAWCDAASHAVLEGNQCWLVVAHRSQVRWIKRKALDARITLFGIRFLEIALLREELCKLLNVEAISFKSETSELILKAAALRQGSLPDSTAIARDARACRCAMEDLHAAGWSSDEMDVPAQMAHDFSRALTRSRCCPPVVDRALVKTSELQQPLWTCFVGLDAEHWPEIELLSAAKRCSAQCAAFLPLPRAAAERVQQSWIEAVESRLGATRTVCNASDFHSPNEGLLSRLEKNALSPQPLHPPRLLIGHDWRDQVRLVCDEVYAWLAASPNPEARLAIVAPDRSPTSVAIVRTLTEEGLEVLDEVGEIPEPNAAVLIQLQVIRYHLLGHDVAALIELCKLLNEALPETWRWLEPDKAHELLTDAFCSVQSRNARLLMCGRTDARSGVWQQIARVVDILDKWQEEELTWSDARKKWARCIAQLGLSIESLEPLWSRTQNLLRGAKFPARLFLEHLGSVLAAKDAQRPSEAARSQARVVVTTLAGAQNQTWSRLLFLDSNEGVWPIRPDENSFLDDAARTELNRRRGQRGYLLTTADEAAIAQAHFLNLLEHCAGEIVFAAATRDPEDATRELQPNEWAIRCLVESEIDAKTALAQWNDAVRVCTVSQPELNADERSHLQAIHTRRRDPQIPFDAYLFNFHGSTFQPDAWPATQLDLAVTCPATFALGQIFGVEPVAHAGFQRGEGAAVGSHAHAWLLHALGGSEEMRPFHPQSPRAAMDTEIKASMQRFARCFRDEGLELPLWWETCFRKAAWAAHRCLAHVLKLEGEWFYAMEKNMRCAVHTSDGELLLKGRFDLLLSDRHAFKGAHVVILDFKTGKAEAPRLASLGRGAGHQFAAYFLIGKDAGAASVSAGVIRPQETKLDVFTDDVENELREAGAPLARLQRELNFGQRGPLVAERGSFERLPMATTAIDPAILDSKAKLECFAAP